MNNVPVSGAKLGLSASQTIHFALISVDILEPILQEARDAAPVGAQEAAWEAPYACWKLHIGVLNRMLQHVLIMDEAVDLDEKIMAHQLAFAQVPPSQPPRVPL